MIICIYVLKLNIRITLTCDVTAYSKMTGGLQEIDAEMEREGDRARQHGSQAAPEDH